MGSTEQCCVFVWLMQHIQGVSATAGTLLELDIAPGNTGNLLEFSLCCWKVSWLAVYLHTSGDFYYTGMCTHGSPWMARRWALVGTHLHRLIFRNFSSILILYGLSRKNLRAFFENVSWISPGNWLGCFRRHRDAQTVTIRGHHRVVVLRVCSGYHMMTEGQEKDDFWSVLGGKGDYSNSPRLQVLPI